MYLRPSLLSRPPQSGVAGGRPNPRKLREAAAIITPPTVMLNMMIMTGIILGRTCRISVVVLGLPIASRRQKVIILFNADHGASDYS